MRTFLVTGGCGFIGSHLCAALRARGDAVRVVDDLSSGSEANLAPGARLIRGDVADASLMRDAIDGVDGCFHLAAIASVERGRREWLATHRTNLSGTISVLDAARTGRAGRPVPVVYASSAAVYGDPVSLPLAEDAPALPMSAYGADKLACELHARVAGVVHGVPTFGLRFFNVFGPRQDPGSPYSGVISIFCDRLARGDSIDVFGDGQQTRDFVFVTDVAAALLEAMENTSASAPVVNVCTGRAVSIIELATKIAQLCGVTPQICHRPPRAGEIRHSLGSPSRACAALRLAEPVPLGAGLEQVLGWMRAGRRGLAEAALARA